MRRNNRAGITILEILVVVAITAILIGLLLPAIQRIRSAALRAKSANHLRQIGIALHHYDSTNEGRLPSIDPNPIMIGPVGPYPMGHLGVLLPFLEQQTALDGFASPAAFNNGIRVSTYLSPADPSIPGAPPGKVASATSYIANAQVFRGSPRFAELKDGSSSTVAYAERYAVNCGGVQTLFIYAFTADARAVFADGGPGSDFIPEKTAQDYPITTGSPAVSRGSRGRTFQVAPRVDDCDYRLANTPHNAGMLVCLMDGSVRLLSPAIAETTYWGLVTPNRGDTIGDY